MSLGKHADLRGRSHPTTSFFYCREQLAESILHEGSTGCRVVEKFLKILQVVVQEPGQVFKPFLPSVISLCMEQVYPIIAEVGLLSLQVNAEGETKTFLGLWEQGRALLSRSCKCQSQCGESWGGLEAERVEDFVRNCQIH